MKPYTEEQYLKYRFFMGRLSTDNVVEGLVAYAEYRVWLDDNKLTEDIVSRMGDRLEKECIEQMNKEKNKKKNGKVIKFPKQDSGEEER